MKGQEQAARQQHKRYTSTKGQEARQGTTPQVRTEAPAQPDLSPTEANKNPPPQNDEGQNDQRLFSLASQYITVKLTNVYRLGWRACRASKA